MWPNAWRISVEGLRPVVPMMNAHLSTWPSATEVEDLFLHRQVEWSFHRRRLRFDLARSVFAAASVDAGSALLLRHLQAVGIDHVQRMLDVGSGQGTLGVVLSALDPSRQLSAVDRDALACRYTIRNLALNASEGTVDGAVAGNAGSEVVGSLGYDAVSGLEPPDLVVSNIPGKAGQAVIGELVRGAGLIGAQGTMVGFVVVEPLKPLLTELVEQSQYTVLLDKGNKTHHVIVATVDDMAEQPPLRGFDDGLYDRGRQEFGHKSLVWACRPVFGLGEFDGLSYPSMLLRAALQGVPGGPAVIAEPGQGHRAVIAARSGCRPETLISRDLLALRASARCLDDAEVTAATPRLVHDVDVTAALGPETTTVIYHADDKIHGPYFVDQVRRVLDHLEQSSGRTYRDLVLTGRSGMLGRLEVDVLRRRRGHVAHKQSRRGYRALRFRLSA